MQVTQLSFVCLKFEDCADKCVIYGLPSLMTLFKALNSPQGHLAVTGQQAEELGGEGAGGG